MLSVKNLSKQFNSKKDGEKIEPLKGVNFEIKKSEIVGIVGKSGEGKSTIARILCGALKKDNGEINLFGQSLFDSRGKYKREIGIAIQLVSQVPYLALDPMQKVGDGILEILRAHNKKLSVKQCEDKTMALLEKVWLGKEIVKRLPSEISSGQAQRIGIARALAVNPKLLIADESTAMLDVKSQAQVISIYRDLVEKEGMSILFISHDLELVDKVSTRKYSLENGKLIEI